LARWRWTVGAVADLVAGRMRCSPPLAAAPLAEAHGGVGVSTGSGSRVVSERTFRRRGIYAARLQFIFWPLMSPMEPPPV